MSFCAEDLREIYVPFEGVTAVIWANQFSVPIRQTERSFDEMARLSRSHERCHQAVSPAFE